MSNRRGPLRFLGVAALTLLSCDTGSAPEPARGGFAVRDVVYRRSQAGYDQIILQVTSLPGVCSLYGTGSAQTDAQDFDVITVVFVADSGGLAKGPKTLVDPDADSVSPFTPTTGRAYYEGTRGCERRHGVYATGSVDITNLDSSRIAGEYRFVFSRDWPYGDSVSLSGVMTGAFDAARCAPPGDPVPEVLCK